MRQRERKQAQRYCIRMIGEYVAKHGYLPDLRYMHVGVTYMNDSQLLYTYDELATIEEVPLALAL